MANSTSDASKAYPPLTFLRIPPFPGNRAAPLAVAGKPMPGSDPSALADALRTARVGGAFWGPQPVLPDGRDVILCPGTGAPLSVLLEMAEAFGQKHRVAVLGPDAKGVPGLPADSDPWHICASASRVIAAASHEFALVAALTDTDLVVAGQGTFAGADTLTIVERMLVQGLEYRDPFTGSPIGAIQAVAQLAKWRALIDENRKARAIYGVARWKRITADAMLWDGSGPVRHADGKDDRRITSGESVLAWIARSDARRIDALKANGVSVGEIEDGMIRSTGLGANCVPPLSIVVDYAGPHFDPAQPSTLETLLQTADIDSALTERAVTLRETLVEGGISKYEHDSERTQPPILEPARRRVLVTGQVEDDRAMLCGGAGMDNLELLRRARAHEPDAHIIFKPHPDVEAGHRIGAIPDEQALEFADEIDRTSSIAALLDRVDCIHVISSLAGFEALMRGLEVVTHGVPFYSGWGLTRDLGPVPHRRTRKRTLDELVAATLLIYPRYIDPVTRLPCDAELLVERIAEGEAEVRSPLVFLRELQGRFNRVAAHLPFAKPAR